MTGARPTRDTEPGQERGLALLARKARAGMRLVRHYGGRAATRVANLTGKQWRHYRSRLARVWNSVTYASRDALTALVNLTRLAGRRLAGMRKPFIRAWKRRERSRQVAAALRLERRVERTVGQIASSRGPIILGPWLSEVGFEVLYWVPFLHWLKAQHNWDSGRLVAISRGGVASWYRGLADSYVEVFDHLDPADFARRSEIRREAGEGSHKQMALSDLDREIIDYAQGKMGIRDAAVLHPSQMYRLFRYYWLGHRGVSFVEERTRFSRRAAPAAFDLSRLPRDYVAVKAYTAASLPDTPRNQQALHALVRHLSSRMNVVTLDTGLAVDDHADYRLDVGHRVANLTGLMTPANNLELQTQVIAGARAFVGTCGSLTWLAPMLGINTVALLSDARFLHPHLYFARKAYLAMDAASFATVDIKAIDHLGLDDLFADLEPVAAARS